ncbi:MAG: hypothetical protein IKU95_00135, partial [Clostridia bacterium]|nr:hypothetical protein [Clostridia bacterium]
EILRQTENLRKIRFFEKAVSSNLRFSNHFNLEQDLSVHVNCESLTEINDKIFYNSVGGYAQYTPEKGIFDAHSCNIIIERPDNVLGEMCTHARRMNYFRECMRTRVIYESKEQLEHLLGELHESLRLQGRKAQTQFYIRKKIVRKDGVDRMIFDILVPLEEKQA